MEIRRATFDDVGELFRMMQAFADGTRYGELVRPRKEALAHLLQKVLEVGMIHVAALEPGDVPHSWIAGPVDRGAGPIKLAGFIAIVQLVNPLNGELYGDELAWWVDKDFRAEGIGHKLLGSIEEWARQTGLSVLKLVSPQGSTIGTFYESKGYVNVETAYQKRLTDRTDDTHE